MMEEPIKENPAGWRLEPAAEKGQCRLVLTGDWKSPVPKKRWEIGGQIYLAGQQWVEYGPCFWNEMSSSERVKQIPWLGQIEQLEINWEGGENWDSLSVAFLYEVTMAGRSAGWRVLRSGVPEGMEKLLKMAESVPPLKKENGTQYNWLERVGLNSLTLLEKMSFVWLFIGELLYALWRLVTFRSRMRTEDFVRELRKAGPDGLPIVCLIGFLMGLILAFIGSILLKMFAAEIYVATLIGIGMFRLMGAVMTGAVIAGRTGAAYAAELGTMQSNEEIDALSTMGISPIEFLVLPRMLALTVMMPLLCLFSNLMGVIGGMIVANFYLDISPVGFWNQMVETTGYSQLLIGLFTSWVFGILVALCGCFKGLYSGRSADAVGKATTGAMVSSVVSLVIATAIITVITVLFGV